ncbi:MAG: FliM/FliN family flagellar motor switch protein [Treponema sp.]|nr:FliM/FliN family flagellar motor switch protein [Treponema sp.]
MMTNVLSQDEIDQLLEAINSDDSESFTLNSIANTRKIKIYDFKRPDLPKEQMLSVIKIHDEFVRLITTKFARLEDAFFIYLRDVEHLTCEEFARSVPIPATFGIVNLAPFDGKVILYIDPDLSNAFINRHFGGKCILPKNTHALTNLERIVIKNVMHLFTECLKDSWQETMKINPTLLEIETKSMFSMPVSPAEMIVMVNLEASFCGVEGIVTIVYPSAMISKIADKLIHSLWAGKKIPLKANKELKNLEDIPIKMTAEILKRDFPLAEVLQFKEESLIFPLCHSEQNHCYLKIGDKRVWKCKILKNSKWFSKQIEIISLVELPFNTDGGNMTIDKVNPLVSDSIFNATLHITAELGSTALTVRQAMGLGEGSIIELDKKAGEAVDIVANGVLIAQGEVVVVDDTFAVRITEILNSFPTEKEPQVKEKPENS